MSSLSKIIMAQYFKKTGENLFCQDFLLQGAMEHVNPFLSRLNGLIDFEQRFEQKLLVVYKGRCTLGAPSYKPSLLLKMLFLAYLFKLSEREIERVINDSISMKGFLGLAFDEPAPDHSSLTQFKNRILAFDRSHSRDIFREIFDEVILYSQEKGVDLGYTQVVDSTHTVADVNTQKDKKRQKPPSKGGDSSPPRDPDAHWGVKREKEQQTTDGTMVKVPEYVHGYKSHLSGSAKTNLITSFLVSPMNRYDGHFFKPLLDDDWGKSIVVPGKTTYAADRGYDDGDVHVWLNQKKLKDAISLKYVKKEDRAPSGRPKVRWGLFTNQEEFELGLSQRYTIERMNASLKKDIGLGRARYLGLQKMNIQTAFSCLTHNLKTLVKLLTGTGLRSPVIAHVS